MANNEAQFCKELIDAFKLQVGGIAYRQNDRFLKSIPDIYLCGRAHGPMMIEAKFSRAPKREASTIPLALTELQRKYNRDARRAGAVVGWALCVKYAREWRLWVGVDDEVQFVYQDNPSFVRKVGGKWLMNEMCQLLVDNCRGNNGLR